MPRNKNLPASSERGSGYSKEVKDRIHALLKSGKSPKTAGEELGIRAATIWGWYRDAAKPVPKEAMEAHQREREQGLKNAREKYRNMSEEEKRRRREERKRRKQEGTTEQASLGFSQPAQPAPPAQSPPPSRPSSSNNGAPPGYITTYMPNSETAIGEALRTALDERDALKRTLEIYQRENDALKRRLNEGR
jgi:hypothetical protein